MMQMPECNAGSAALPIFTEADEQQEKATLTQEEVDSARADLYGMSESAATYHISEEEDVPEALYMLDRILEEMPRDRKAAFLEAQRKCPDLVDDSHKEAFLWAENLDVELAAERLVKYWALKQQIFGSEKCFLPLTLQGAVRDDIEALAALNGYVLPDKDLAGRSIIYVNGWPDILQHKHESLLRALWYISSVAIKESQVQKLGVAILCFPQKGLQNPFHPEFQRFVMRRYEMERCFPMRIRALHFVQPNPMLRCALAFAKKFMGRRLRQRIQVHSGTDEDVLRSLGGFGFPRAILPSELGGPVVLRGPTSTPVLRKVTSGTKVGRKSDPRMDRAVEEKLNDQNMPLLEALERGGFTFDHQFHKPGMNDSKVFDADNVSLRQRKNQLNRRFRKATNK